MWTLRVGAGILLIVGGKGRHQGCTPASGREGRSVGREGRSVGREGGSVGREGGSVGREGGSVGWEGRSVGWEGRSVGREGRTVGRSDGKVRRSMRLKQRSDREKANGSSERRRADRGCTPASTDTPTQHHFAIPSPQTLPIPPNMQLSTIRANKTSRIVLRPHDRRWPRFLEASGRSSTPPRRRSLFLV